MPIDFTFHALRKCWRNRRTGLTEAERLSAIVNKTISTYYLLHSFVSTFSLPNLERMSLFTLTFEVLDSNIPKFVNLIFRFFEVDYSSCQNKLLILKASENLEVFKAVKFTSRPLVAKFSTL